MSESRDKTTEGVFQCEQMSHQQISCKFRVGEGMGRKTNKSALFDANWA